jgi:hypothetical protein
VSGRLEHRVDRLSALVATNDGIACQHTAIIDIAHPGHEPKPRARARCESCGRLDEAIVVRLSFDPKGGR